MALAAGGGRHRMESGPVPAFRAVVLRVFWLFAYAPNARTEVALSRRRQIESAMKNPWTKRNPFMSMWLSAANTAAGSARSRLTAASKRQASTMMNAGIAQAADFWTKALTPPIVGKKRRKPRSK